MGFQIPELSIDFRLIDVHSFGNKAFALRFQVPPTMVWRAGQYVFLQLPEKKSPVPLSIASAKTIDGAEMELLVEKRNFSESLQQELDLFQRLGQAPTGSALARHQWLASSPQGDSIWARWKTEPETVHSLLVVGMGTGLSPLKATVEEMQFCQSESPILFLHGARYEDELHFRQRLEQSIGTEQLQYLPTLTEATLPWQGMRGRVFDALKNSPQGQHELVVGGVSFRKDSYVYGCGSGEMTAELKSRLIDLGISPDRIVVEGY
ncbi:MAG: hypothetical protein MK135_14855 [Polyangiaceae bacterium]|nr:hypothetical protein [Polyangiaceae bacterium]